MLQNMSNKDPSNCAPVWRCGLMFLGNDVKAGLVRMKKSMQRTVRVGIHEIIALAQCCYVPVVFSPLRLLLQLFMQSGEELLSITLRGVRWGRRGGRDSGSYCLRPFGSVRQDAGLDIIVDKELAQRAVHMSSPPLNYSACIGRALSQILYHPRVPPWREAVPVIEEILNAGQA
jgi:hypothetical protein